ncbi:hypothetical protein DPM33_19170 [Mesorhizobium hawassense]|uniref:Uncharacterized protein n=1 Tax=Mesorhizobium hawassense TaxID=1209954 RepID=A0A330HP21_9HYPH|nr:hypothetical protein DPM33_19170 [Mesorhizobium hawassense]
MLRLRWTRDESRGGHDDEKRDFAHGISSLIVVCVGRSAPARWPCAAERNIRISSVECGTYIPQNRPDGQKRPGFCGAGQVDTVIIIGAVTSICRESTARSAFMRDYRWPSSATPMAGWTRPRTMRRFPSSARYLAA